jgi:hypothetical protein
LRSALTELMVTTPSAPFSSMSMLCSCPPSPHPPPPARPKQSLTSLSPRLAATPRSSHGERVWVCACACVCACVCLRARGRAASTARASGGECRRVGGWARGEGRAAHRGSGASRAARGGRLDALHAARRARTGGPVCGAVQAATPGRHVQRAPRVEGTRCRGHNVHMARTAGDSGRAGRAPYGRDASEAATNLKDATHMKGSLQTSTLAHSRVGCGQAGGPLGLDPGHTLWLVRE